MPYSQVTATMLSVMNAASAAPSSSRPRTPIYGRNAPSQHLFLPKTEIITVVEMATYFPNSLRNYEILLRFVQHGIDQQTIANIVNLHRTWEKMPVLTNSICKSIEKAFIEDGDKKNWCVGDHEKGIYTYYRDWLDDELNLSGTSLKCEKKPKYSVDGEFLNPLVEDVVMADLARNVTVHPSYFTGDGFMLTRCIQYAAAHLEKGYVFPRDYAQLVKKLDDGRVVTAAHYDKPSVERFKTKRSWTAKERPYVENFDGVDGSSSKKTEHNSAQLPVLNHHQQTQNPSRKREAASYAPGGINNSVFHHPQNSTVPQAGHGQLFHQAQGFAGFPTVFRKLSHEPLSMAAYPSDTWELPGTFPRASLNLMGWNPGTAATPRWSAGNTVAPLNMGASLDLSLFEGDMFDDAA
jgi:hypothetical protein